jgi:hypothetical protein
MIPKPHFPQGVYSVGKIGEVTRVLDAKGRDVMTMPGGPERLVECCNALRHVWFPAAHVNATDEQIKKLEALRKAAWARVQELEKAIAGAIA